MSIVLVAGGIVAPTVGRLCDANWEGRGSQRRAVSAHEHFGHPVTSRRGRAVAFALSECDAATAETAREGDLSRHELAESKCSRLPDNTEAGNAISPRFCGFLR